MGNIACFHLYIVCLIPLVVLHHTKAAKYANMCFLLKNQQKICSNIPNIVYIYI